MFTGLVEARGSVVELIDEPPARRLEVEVGSEWVVDSAIGDSVAINGCCLTVVSIGSSTLSFEAGAETLARTNLGDLSGGDPVNLERPLAAGGRLGGHFVQGHIDGTAEVMEVTRDGDWVTMWFQVPGSLAMGQWFQVPGSLAMGLVPKGSVAVDGVSLTVVEVVSDRFSVALIPHTLEVTTLGIRQAGSRVNIETDILAKYVQKLVAGDRPGDAGRQA